MEEKPRIDKVVGIKVSSINDIARFAMSLVSLGQAPYIIRFRKENKVIYGLLAVFRDYYKYYGLPLLYYYVVSNPSEHDGKNYILIRSDEAGEKVELSEGTRPGWIAIPVLDIEAIPDFLNIEV